MALKGDDAVENANEEALKELHENAKEEGEDDGPKHEVVEPQDPDEVEAKPDEPRGEAKRRNRYREQQERAANAERERDELRARLLAAEAAQRYIPQQQGPAQEPRDEHAERIKKLKAEQEACVTTHRAIVGDTPEAQAAREAQRQRYIALNDDIQQTLVDQAVERRGVGQQQMDPAKAIRLEMIRQRYSDVVDHPTLAGHMLAYANGRWEQERVLLRHQYGRDVEVPQNTMDAIFDETRRRFGVARSPTPSTNVRAKFQSSSVGARGASAAPQSSEKKSFPMNKQYLRMARAAHPGKSDKVAFQMWVNDQNSD